MTKPSYVYIVLCSDGSFYTGWTNNIKSRMKKHNQGLGAKYTRARLPVELIYYEVHESRSHALKREYQIKKLKRSGKEKLINMSILKELA